jgi:hypothetical protein
MLTGCQAARLQRRLGPQAQSILAPEALTTAAMRT